MRQRDRNGVLELVADADAFGHALHAEQAARSESTDGDDHLRSDELELPLAPECAEILLARRRCAIAAAGERAPGVTACDGRAVERRVERLFVQVEPPAQRSPGTPAPGQPLLCLLDPGRLPEHVRALPTVRLHDRERLERIAGLGARTADPVVALQRDDRAVATAAPRHARTTTNQSPAKSVSPPPSSAVSSSGSKKRL